MSWSWIVTFAAGFLAGSLVVGVTVRFHQMDRDHLAYWRGVTDERDGLAPLRPVATVPDRSERGTGSIPPAMGGVLVIATFMALGYTVGGW